MLLAAGAIALAAIGRLGDPQSLDGGTMIAVAGIGIVVNGFTAWLFMRGSKHDLNLRGAYLHMAADAAVSVGVVVAGVAIGLTGLLWLDPAIRLAIGRASGRERVCPSVEIAGGAG